MPTPFTMKRLNICGNRIGWLPAFLFVVVMLCSGSLPEALAQIIRGLPEYIYQQPVSAFEREGGSTVFTIIFAYGAKDEDIEVDWFKDGVALSERKPVLQTYVSGTATQPQMWNPYEGYLEDAPDKRTSRPGRDADYMAVWKSELRVDNVTAASAGVYSARTNVGKKNGARRIFSNEAHLSVVAADPAEALKIVSVPPSRSLAAPGSNPRPSLKLYADMKSQVSALFNTPFSTATDLDGFTYVADTLNHCIRRLSPGGRTITVAGIDGQPLEDDLSETSLNDPGQRPAAAGYERSPSPGYREGTSNQNATGYRFLPRNSDKFRDEPRFRAPEALTVSDTGVIYVADTGNHMIRGIRVSGGSADVFPVYGDAPAPNSPPDPAPLPTPGKLNSPRGIVFAGSSSDPVNNPPVLYVMDSSNYSVKKLYLTAGGTLDTSKGVAGCENIAGLGLTPGWQGIAVSATDAKFYSPRGIVFMKDPKTGADTLYIADTVNHVIRQLVRENSQWTAQTVVGFVGAKGDVNGVRTEARLNFPVGLAVDPDNKLLYFSEFGTHSLRRVNLPYSPRTVEPLATRKPWEVDDVAGSGYYGPTEFGPNGPQGTGKGDGLGPDAVFYYPAGISLDNDGSLMVADTNNHVIRKVRIARDGEWLGDSSLVAGIVGHSGNRDFSSNPGFTFKWKKDAVWMTDGPAVSGGTISGSLTDTLYVENIGYQDAGVYALVVTNSFSDGVELPQSFVYVATAGDRPKFLAPGYRIVEQSKPNETLAELQQGMDVYISADILPADQVTYQWEVARETPNGVYDWVPLSDELISLQPRLHALLGDNDATTIRGSTTARLAISKFQSSLGGVLPSLRFRVEAAMRSEPTLTLDPRVEKTGMRATWTVAPPQTVAVGTSSGTLSPGMILSGSGFKQDTKITAVNGGTLTLDTPVLSDQITPGSFTATLGGTSQIVSGSWTGTAVPEQTLKVDSVDNLAKGMYLVAPGSLFDAKTKINSIETSTLGAFVLALNKPALGPGTDRQIYAVEDFSTGIGRSVRYPAAFSDKNLSLRVNGVAPTETPLKSGGAASIFLTAGSTAVIGNPTPKYQWYKKDSVSGTPVALAGETQTSFSVPSVQAADQGYYFVTISNGVGASADSNNVFIDVARPPSLTILSMTLDGGTLTQSVGTRQKRVVDKRTSSELSLTANVDASAQPTYVWEFKPDDPTSTATLADLGEPDQDDHRTYGRLSFANLSDDADGVFTLTITVPKSADAPAAIRTCSWHVTVKYLPKFVPGSKVFLVGTLNLSTGGTTQDEHTLDLSNTNPISLRAEFKTPPTLPILSYRWRRNKTVLDSTVDSLDLPLVARRDIGEYKLEVTNALGMVSISGWKLKASGKPSVVVQPNGKVLGSTSSNLSAGQAGMLAATPRISAVQASAALVPGPLHVAKGQRLALQVTVEGEPLLTYQWYRKDNEKSVLQDGAVSAIYVLPAITSPAKTVLKYYVKAKNDLGEVTSEPIEIRVDEPPEVSISAAGFVSTVSKEAVPMPYPIGSEVRLTANVKDAGAQQSFQWKVNGNEIFGATQQELRLSNIEAGQAGKYSVVVKGVAGTKESASLALSVRTAGTAPKYKVTVEGAEALKTKVLLPKAAATGCAAGTKVMLLGLAPAGKMIQSWEVSYFEEATGQAVVTRLPSRAAKFVMPSADVTATPVLNRSYAGNYSGLLSLEAPWDTASEWPSDPEVFFRPTMLDPDIGKVRGLFSCSVTGLGAVSGQMQLENKTYSFTTVLDPEMKATFRVATNLKGVAWSMKGELSFNPTEENRLQGFLDNVLHVVVSDALLATPPVVEAGQTLYCSAAGVSGAAEALRADLTERLLSEKLGADVPSAAAAFPSAGAAAAAPVEPLIQLQPRSVSVLENGSATFVVMASAGGRLAYQWYDGPTPSDTIAGATGQSYTIFPVKRAVFGTRYRVLVTNLDVPGRPGLGGNDGRSTFSAFATLSEATGPGTGGGGTGTVTNPAAPMVFTSAVYRQTNGETAAKTYGQGAVLSVQVRQPTGGAVVQGYLANGTKVTFSTSLGRAFTTPQVEAPDLLENQPAGIEPAPFFPSSPDVTGQGGDALSEALVRRTSSQTIPLWFRGDSATEPLFGAMVFNGPRVTGSLGALNLEMVNLPMSNSTPPSSVYTTNTLAGYFFDPDEPPIGSLPVTLTIDSYATGLKVSAPTSNSTVTSGTVFASVDKTTGLLLGAMLESTDRYVQRLSDPLSSPSWALFKPFLACTTAGVFIRSPDILPGLSWSANSLGGYVGFLYRGKSSPVERLKNVLGNGTLEPGTLNGIDTNRVEPFLIDIPEEY